MILSTFIHNHIAIDINYNMIMHTTQILVSNDKIRTYQTTSIIISRFDGHIGSSLSPPTLHHLFLCVEILQSLSFIHTLFAFQNSKHIGAFSAKLRRSWPISIVFDVSTTSLTRLNFNLSFFLSNTVLAQLWDLFPINIILNCLTAALTRLDRKSVV